MKSAILLVFSCLCLHAATLEGSFQSAALFQQDPLDSSLPAVQFYEDMDFEIRGIAGREIDLYSGLNYSNRYSDDYRKGSDFRHLFLDWNAFSGKLFTRSGRQWYYEGLSPVTMDGMRVRFRDNRGWSLLLAGGRTVTSPYLASSFLPEKKDTTRFLADVALSFRPIRPLKTGLIYERLFDDRSFSSDRVRVNTLALPASLPLTAGGEVTACLNSLTLDRAGAFAGYSLSRQLEFSLELARESRDLDSSSLLEVFSLGRRTEARLGADITFSDTRSARAGWTSRFFKDGRDVHTAGIDIYWGRLFAGAEQDLGGPQSTLARAGASLPKIGPLASDLQGTFLRYKTGDAFRESYAGVAGLDYRPFDFWDIRAEGQYVRNRWFDRDLRLFLKTVLQLTRGGDE